MFAFSQIIASGQKVNAVTDALEKEEKKEEKANPDAEINDAILAFSDSLPGNDGAPKIVETDKEAEAKEDAATAELAQLYTNDATAAFANMVQPLNLAQVSSTSQLTATAEAKHQSVQALEVLKQLQQQVQEALLNPNAQSVDSILPQIQAAVSQTQHLSSVLP